MAEPNKASVRSQLDDPTARGIKRLSESPRCSQRILVKKRDGGIRLCVGYEDVSDVTTSDGFELPRMEEQINQIQCSTIFSRLALLSAYHQIKLSEQAIAKTTFSADSEHCEFLRFPMESPKEIQRPKRSRVAVRKPSGNHLSHYHIIYHNYL